MAGTEDDGLTRYQYLMIKAVAGGASMFIAREAVHSVAIEHPEWDLDERRTWDEWESANQPIHDDADRSDQDQQPAE